MRYLALIAVLSAVVLAGGCSNSSSDAPLPGEAHPADWVLLHAATATTDLDDCRTCHGAGLAGSGDALSCFACHSYNAAPPFTIHPVTWDDAREDHRPFLVGNGFDYSSCALAACHGSDQPIPLGGVAGPSCSSATFDGRSCHAGGPAPHGLPFTDPAQHGEEAKRDLSACQLCHGTPGTILFDGGLVDTACSDCHPAAGAHPTRWQGDNDNTPAYSSSHRNAGSLGTACSICHNVAADAAGPHPGAPSCFSDSFTNAESVTSSCHPGGPVPHTLEASWLLPAGHVAGFDADTPPCFDCHTVTAAGGGTSPACMDCHTLADPTTAPRDCSSCHSTPPDDSSAQLAVRPNRKGAHDAHFALPTFSGRDDCSACHRSAGSDTLAHYDEAAPADVTLDTSLYNALGTAPARRNVDGSCSGVSCHGGQTTGIWLTGTLDVATGCDLCHKSSGTAPAQYNDYQNLSDKTHDFHLGRNLPGFLGGGRRIFCTDCHNTGSLADNHFTSLETTAMEGPASATIGGAGTFITGYSSGTCAPACHSDETWGD